MLARMRVRLGSINGS
ncbi:hypothetical protein MTR67_007939 [Solanum verrucosum]|uniref:Uncharacterized protein n=1 Tax=Solanum verrucosum TaxID=315347 RepID=A0AAF0Q712_SOLVR|nr:hypothetical protein MTR67_007939 [Solanum verrucosum]